MCAVSIRLISQRRSSCLSHLSFDVRPDLPLTASHAIAVPYPPPCIHIQRQQERDSLSLLSLVAAGWMEEEARRRTHRKEDTATAKIPSASLPAADFWNDSQPPQKRSNIRSSSFLPSSFCSARTYIDAGIICIYPTVYYYYNKSKERDLSLSFFYFFFFFFLPSPFSPRAV